MKLPVVIMGSGGHAKVVADALLAAGEQVLGFTDVDPSRHERTLCGLPVLGDDHFLDSYTPSTLVLANGIGGTGSAGSRLLRCNVQQRLSARGWRFVTVQHPTAVVSAGARSGEGAQFFAGSVVQVDADIGDGCILNTGAIVEHDSRLGPWVHVAPGAVVCGDAAIGQRSHVGAGAVVRQGVKLGDDTVVGAGAVVVRDFLGAGILCGIPARPMEHKR